MSQRHDSQQPGPGDYRHANPGDYRHANPGDYRHANPGDYRQTRPDSTIWELPLQPVFTFWANAANSVGSAPIDQLRVSLGFGVAWPLLSFSVEARGFLPASAGFRSNSLEVARWDGALLPCLSKLSILVCGILSVGGVHGDVSGAHEDIVVSFHATGGIRVGFVWPLTTQLSLGVHTDVEASLSPTLIQLDELTAWAESVGQVAVGFAISGAIPGIHQ